jgi:hypothetical protein
MRLPVRRVGWALPLFLTGCFFHHTHQAPNQQLAPPLAPKAQLNPTPVDLPPAASTIPTEPTQNAKAPTEQAPRPHHHRKPADKNLQEAANTPPDTPSAPPSVSAIGQLSSGDPADYRNETAESINSIERGLNGIGRPLSDSEQKIAENIREFLKEARAALATGDVDGAHTLAIKAKVLLAELTK